MPEIDWSAEVNGTGGEVQALLEKALKESGAWQNVVVIGLEQIEGAVRFKYMHDDLLTGAELLWLLTHTQHQIAHDQGEP